MLNYQVKIGLVPLRRDIANRPDIFNWEKAEERGRKAVAYIREHYTSENVSFVDLAGINDTAILYHEYDVPKVVSHFQAEKVDAIFLINSNFGNEIAAAQVAKAMNKPVLLWAPIDDEFAPDGMRFTDSQCGVFAISKQLQRRNIPFTYIENCAIDDPKFDQGFQSFVSVACMVNNFRGMRMAQVGLRPQTFSSVIFNESELLQRFDIQIVPVNLAEIINRFHRIMKENDEELEEGAKLLASLYEVDEATQPLLKKMYAFVPLYKEIFHAYNVQVVSSECWSAMQQAVGVLPWAAFGILADMGYYVSMENDVHGAITTALLSCATLGKRISFSGEFTVRHPTNHNAELLWHPGPFAYSLKKPSSIAKLVNMRPWFEVKEGEYTVARLDQDQGNYSLLTGVCRAVEGPYTFGTYLWAEFDDLDKWERKLIEGPYIHHLAEIAGDYRREMEEFCKYISDITYDTV